MSSSYNAYLHSAMIFSLLHNMWCVLNSCPCVHMQISCRHAQNPVGHKDDLRKENLLHFSVFSASLRKGSTAQEHCCLLPHVLLPGETKWTSLGLDPGGESWMYVLKHSQLLAVWRQGFHSPPKKKEKLRMSSEAMKLIPAADTLADVLAHFPGCAL